MMYNIFSETAVCSSSLLRATLSTCQEGLLEESLKLIVSHRLQGNPWDTKDHEKEEYEHGGILAVPQYDTMDGSAPQGKYAALFTFTCNRYNTTSSSLSLSSSSFYRNPSRNEPPPVNYEDALIWEDVRRSGLVFWYRNKPLFMRLALRMAMVGMEIFSSFFH